MKALVAGPWVGELGWELMRWQGHVRFMYQHIKADKLIVATQRGHEYFYNDMNPEVFHSTLNPQANGWMEGTLNPQYTTYEKNYIKKMLKDCSDVTYLKPTKETTSPQIRQVFISYGKPNKEYATDVLFHIRDVKRNRSTRRNWKTANWVMLNERLSQHGIKVGCIGLSNHALHIIHTSNFLNVNIRYLVNIIASTKLVIGPSSGPMHLASLCKIPHLVWTDNRKWGSVSATNRERYETLWNPFQTKVKVLDDCNWQPTVNQVYEAVLEML